ncbi:branched-chain amino acid ABC transporter permease [Rhodoligotrophos ferricapiens]|uniref:branched-chain amino acid ABC transporter permease n=1 Tax=Rhodoligotrophos ferricapiens TaxID=3069264 RepID=UPI00315D474B
MNTSLFFGQVVTGLVAGAGYAVVAVGLSYTLGLARVMNFAFGTFYMLAAFAILVAMNQLGLGYALACIAAVVVITLVALVFSRIVLLPAMRISEPSVMIASLGAGVVLTSLAQWLFGADVSYIDSPLLNRTYHLGVASFTQQAVATLIAAPVIAFGLNLFMQRSLLGQRIRAVAESPELAAATGLRTTSLQAVAATIGIALAAVAATIYAPTGVVSVFMGDEILLKAFTIAAIAGVGRIWGAVIMGFAIGVFEALVGGFISSAYSTAAIYLLLIGTLIIFPRGIFSGH